ncbi:MAG: right-handed parallel beta-helix repeat-containing protein, partial [Planctomycetaceae bacterium]
MVDSLTLGPNDLVLVDTGTYEQGVLFTANDEGITVGGSPGTSRINGTVEMADSDYNTLYRLTLGAADTSVWIHGTSADVTSNTTLRRLQVLSSSIGIRIEGGLDNAVVDSQITGTGNYGLYLPSGGGISVTGTTISGRSIGGYFDSLASGALAGNDISATTYALFFNYGTNLSVSNNDLHHAQYGLYRQHGEGMTVSGNRMFNNQTGAYSYYGTTTYLGNTVSDNVTGLAGWGTFGTTDWSAPNIIRNNGVGVRPAAGQSVAFNRILDNQVGIEPLGSATIRNNLLAANTTGILIGGVSHVTVVNNTIVTPSGTGVRLQQSASNVSLRNNILSTTSGTGLYVATDSQQGFTSDYNNHHTSGAAPLIWWQKPFTDLFDWQVEGDLDRHS